MELLSRFKKYILAFIDILMVGFAYVVAYAFLGTSGEVHNMLVTLYVSAVTYLLVFLFLGIYHNIVRYSGMREYLMCFLACMISAVLICVENRFLMSDGASLKEIKPIILSGLFAGLFTMGVRVLIRMVYAYVIKKQKQEHKTKRLLIIGAGEGANLAIRELTSSSERRYEVVGLIDDNDSKIGCRISGHKVLGTRKSIPRICKEKKVDTILFAIPSADGQTRKEILDICAQTGCKLQTMPHINEVISGESINQMRQVSIADLLNREPVKLNNETIGSLVKDRVVMVTGGGGSIGSELCRQIARFKPARLLILDIYENNAYDTQQELLRKYPNLNLRVLIASVRDRERIEDVFNKYRPSLVFHAAAHKHVPLMEDDPKEAVKNNVFGTLNLAQCADKYGVEKFVLISTDKAVNPTNVMGATKRICEMIIQSMNTVSETDFAAVRFGNVLGSNGSVIPLFRRQLEAGGPLTVTHKEITRFFMTIPEAAKLVLQAASDAEGGEIFVLDMGEPVKIYDLAENFIRLSGLKPGRDIDIEIVGLRPGEKLYEELMMEEEGLKATKSQKIFIAKLADIQPDELQGHLDNLQGALAQEGNLPIVQAIHDTVSTYKADARWDIKTSD